MKKLKKLKEKLLSDLLSDAKLKLNFHYDFSILCVINKLLFVKRISSKLLVAGNLNSHKNNAAIKFYKRNLPKLEQVILINNNYFTSEYFSSKSP